MGTFIRNKLWLGGVEDAYDVNKLKAQGTTHILTIECSSLREVRPSQNLGWLLFLA